MVDRFSTSPPRPFRADYILAYSRSSLLIKDIIIYYYWFISAWPDPARLWNVCERREEGQCVVLLFQATCLTLSYSFPLTSLSRVHLIQVNCLSSHMRSLISDICNTRPKRLNVLYCLWWHFIMPQRPCKVKVQKMLSTLQSWPKRTNRRTEWGKRSATQASQNILNVFPTRQLAILGRQFHDSMSPLNIKISKIRLTTHFVKS